MHYDQFTTKTTFLERRVLVGPMDQGKKILEELYRDKWHINRSGPYTDSDMFPKCDDTRFLFIAERTQPAPTSSPIGPTA